MGGMEILDILYSLELNTKDSFKKLEENEKGKMMPIITNLAFNTLINNESRIKYAAYIIALVLNEDYEEVLNNLTIEKPTIDKITNNEAEKRLDCLCKYHDTWIDIEMNGQPDKSRLNRNEDYAWSLFGQRKKGSPYIYNNCIQINLNNFNFSGIEDVVHCYENKETLTGKDIIMSGNVKIYHVNLAKIHKKYYNKEELNKLELLMVVMNEKDDSPYLEELIKGDKIMKEFREEAKKVSLDDDNWFAYQREIIDERYKEAREIEVREEGEAKGIEKGIEQGVDKTKREVVEKMLKENLDISLISKIGGLSKDEIKEIKKNLKV